MAASRKPKVSHRAGYKLKGMGIGVEVGRTISPSNGKPGFKACAWVSRAGGGVFKKGQTRAYVCGDLARNPRLAVASSLKKLAAHVAGRTGTFARYR